MKFRNIAALLALSATLVACVSGNDDTKTEAKPTAGFQAQFNTSFGIMPFPNDLYFNGSKTGQLNIPGDPTVAANGPLLALNHLDGYGTQSDIKAYFTAPVDKTSLTAANIAVLKVTSDPTTKAVTGFVKQLHQGVDYSVSLSPGSDADGLVVNITPLKPLDPSTIDPLTSTAVPSTYLVIITKGVKATDGSNAEPSAEFAAIVKADTDASGKPVASAAKINLAPTDPLFPVAAFTLAQLTVANAVGVKPDAVAVAFSFSTGYLKVALTEVAATAAPTTQPSGVGIVDTGKTVCDVLVLSKQLANTAACAGVPGSTVTEVFAGTVALPYYLTVPAKGSTAALTDSWHNAKGGDVALNATDPTSFVPKATKTQNIIPILAALPMATSGCTMPGSGWPVTIFQHGITRNREDMLAVASALSVGGAPTLCTAVLAIDLPLHGVTDTTDPFYKNQLFTGTAAAALLTKTPTERTFDMDANGVAGAAAADIAGSGTLFINLTSTITSRDNLREGAADLLNLVATLPNMTAISPPSTVNIFDQTKVFFVGHSLGAIVGTDFLAASAAGATLNPTEPTVTASVLAMPGGHIAKLLTDSPAFASQINQGLADKGLATGTQEYYDFLNEAQAVVEDGDPANYAADAAAGVPIHMIEVVGGHDSSSPPDQVVPNSATDVLITQMGITTPIFTVGAVNPIAAGIGNSTLAQFTTGDHGSILDPTAPDNASASVQAEYAAVTVEMQKESASVVFDFLAGAPVVTITDNTYLRTTLKK